MKGPTARPRFAVACVLAALVTTWSPPRARGQSLPPPSANKEKAGTYQVDTPNPKIHYWVCVPQSYAPGAGIHLFFHGQNGQGGAKNFGQWSKHFLEPFDLIGINMQFDDGDNLKETDAKMRAAVAAVAQVCADYQVVPARGAVGSFSGGGLPHGLMFTQFGRGGKGRGPQWPFTHCALYDANFRESVNGAMPMSWFVGLGGKEWNLAELGATQTAAMGGLLRDSLRGGVPDLFLRVEAEKGHSMSDADVAASAAGFHRSDLAFAPFVYSPAFADREVRGIADVANTLALGRAAASLDRLSTRKGLDPAVKRQADDLRKLLDDRVTAVFALASTLAEQDPVLFAYYAPTFARQLAGHPREKEFRDVLAAGQKQKTAAQASAAYAAFAQQFSQFFTDKGKVTPRAAGLLKDLADNMPKESLLGQMAAEYLELK